MVRPRSDRIVTGRQKKKGQKGKPFAQCERNSAKRRGCQRWEGGEEKKRGVPNEGLTTCKEEKNAAGKLAEEENMS